ASFLVILREGFEATLLVAILLAYMAKMGRRRGARTVWAGVVAAAVLSLGVGAALFATASGLGGKPGLIFKGVAMWVAVGFLTYMVLWMRRQSKTVAGDIRRSADEALESGGLFALASLSFVMVFREGLETALFMFSVTQTSTPVAVAAGGFAGLAGAIGLGYAVYVGGKRINLGLFFKVTGMLLLIVAAGLLARGVAMFEMAGLFPAIFYPLWDLTGVAILTSGSIIGQFLTAFVGWDPKPDLIEFSAWAVYLLAVGWLFLRTPESKKQDTSAAQTIG
ncbi:MAG: FTR1 family protein, partial [Actinomycetota bacterium]